METVADTTTAQGLDALVAAVGDLVDHAPDNAARVELLRGFEDLKCVLEAAQAQLAVDLDHSTREQQRAAGVAARKVGEGVAAQVALARRVSPHRGSRLLGLAHALVEELPHTFELMRAGWLSEHRAFIISRETTHLDPEQRALVDADLCRTGKAASLGDRKLENAVKKLAYELDPAQSVKRAAKAATDRRVTARPAPDTMVNLNALLPVADGVAVYAALTAAADTARAAGDERTRGQVMADTLVERVTGHAAGQPAKVEIRLVMTDHTMLEGGAQPGYIPGYGPIPAAWARHLAGLHMGGVELARHDAPTRHHRSHRRTTAWLKRLYTRPETGELVAMEARSRRVPDGLAEFVAIRDGGTCATPYCDAPIRHVDHIERYTDGGPTNAANTRGLCERCNLAREAQGWQARPRADGGVETTTPTGHKYISRPPESWPRTRGSGRPRLELAADLVFAA